MKEAGMTVLEVEVEVELVVMITGMIIGTVVEMRVVRVVRVVKALAQNMVSSTAMWSRLADKIKKDSVPETAVLVRATRRSRERRLRALFDGTRATRWARVRLERCVRSS